MHRGSTAITCKFVFITSCYFTCDMVTCDKYIIWLIHQVLIRWTPNPSEDYTEPTGYQVMIRDIRTPWNQGWRTLANVTEEITGCVITMLLWNNISFSFIFLLWQRYYIMNIMKILVVKKYSNTRLSQLEQALFQKNLILVCCI